MWKLLTEQLAVIHKTLFEGGWFTDGFDFVKTWLNGQFNNLFVIICAALGALLLLFGKRLMPLIRFISMFAVGFVAGYVYLAPVVAPLVEKFFRLDAWIVGVIIGALLAVLCRYTFVAAQYAACAFAGGIFADKFLINADAFNNATASLPAQYKSYIVAAVLGAVLFLIALIFRKTLGRLLTAAFGAGLLYVKAVELAPSLDMGNLIKLGTVTVTPFESLYVPAVWSVGALIAVGVLFLLGFIFQIATRKKY